MWRAAEDEVRALARVSLHAKLSVIHDYARDIFPKTKFDSHRRIIRSVICKKFFDG